MRSTTRRRRPPASAHDCRLGECGAVVVAMSGPIVRYSLGSPLRPATREPNLTSGYHLRTIKPQS